MVKNVLKRGRGTGRLAVRSVKHLTSAQVMISQSVASSPASGWVLLGQSLLRILCPPPPSLPPPGSLPPPQINGRVHVSASGFFLLSYKHSCSQESLASAENSRPVTHGRGRGRSDRVSSRGLDHFKQI